MNLRWLLGNFSDPEFKLTPRQQREVTWIAHRRYLSRRKLALWTAGLALASCLLMGFAFDPLAGLFFRLGRPWPHIISAAIIVVAVSMFAAWMYRYIYVKPVRRAMRDLGYDLCIHCGYRLDNLPTESARCPECGAKREPMIVQAEERPP